MPDEGNFFYLYPSVFCVQEACANVWSTTGQETITDHYEVKCNEFQPFDGFDVIKLEVANLTSVSTI